ncbi:hypothetical protein BH20ACT8_BH20ACT8_10620 [soil metagenome]|jgi:hypothetical protein
MTRDARCGRAKRLAIVSWRPLPDELVEIEEAPAASPGR